ncbi:phosphatase PAP2 family protein [Pelagicoccus sp. SDUM812002]|uniref:phosphatase PAP2 family protein n=1 Tax=Pelagicoccus sp. SDUM812002 TaxID=3041266 RepID=UPI0028108100|nr:phosphatase PAP2 family protein [Pelagicoccus sp. SDUM812002]MDQ8185822.1 phosphatase PAP2 family protein [Pelagicoccus sp. SDUM812002]
MVSHLQQDEVSAGSSKKTESEGTLGMGDWDERVLGWIAEEDVLAFTGRRFLNRLTKPVYLVPLTAAVAVCLALRGRAFAGLAILFSCWGDRFLVGVGWAAWSRARPDVIAEGVAASGFHSFPSGHTAMSTAAYGLLVYLWVRAASAWGERIFALVLATVWVLLVGLARVRLGGHWPSDIPAGLAVALPWVIVVVTA